MTLVKHSKMLDLDILDNEDILDEYLIKAEEKLDQAASGTQAQSRTKSVQAPITTELKESYNSICNYMQKQLTDIKANQTVQAGDIEIENENNLNLIKYFDLCRCILPSGKILWLCPEHRKDQSIQILTTDYGANQMASQNDEFNSILLKKIEMNSASRREASQKEQ